MRYVILAVLSQLLLFSCRSSSRTGQKMRVEMYDTIHQCVIRNQISKFNSSVAGCLYDRAVEFVASRINEKDERFLRLTFGENAVIDSCVFLHENNAQALLILNSLNTDHFSPIAGASAILYARKENEVWMIYYDGQLPLIYISKSKVNPDQFRSPNELTKYAVRSLVLQGLLEDVNKCSISNDFIAQWHEIIR